jgi:outer membrane protein TolC
LIPKQVDAAMLRRRPDVIEAEQTIAVEAEALGITKKEWLPKLSLEASVGTESHSAGDLFGKNSITYSVVPTLSWTMFEGLARKYNTEAARLQMENAIDSYNLTLSTAAQEADNALSSYLYGVSEIKALEDVVKASEGYDTRALDNYKSGLSPYINVAQAQISYLENVNSLLLSRGNALLSLISLHKAVGGPLVPSL